MLKILVVGAGAVGGYFGGRLLEKGEDVTFLVRKKRKNQLEESGLIIESIHGDAVLKPRLIVSGESIEPYDVVLLSMKAYHLDSAIQDFLPYVGPETIIVPLLNGISHLEKLTAAFGESNVLGGLCFIETTLDAEGRIVQTSNIHRLLFGERAGGTSERVRKLAEAFSGTKSSFVLSENIMQDMWQKYLFITTFSGVTSLFRSPIGPIREDKFGSAVIQETLNEAASIMRSAAAPLAENIAEAIWDNLHSIEPAMKSSLQRDMEKELSVEADHFFGYLLVIAKEREIAAPTLEKIFANLRIYEKQKETFEQH